MNARKSIAYFRSIGLELRPSTAKHQRWMLVVPGDPDVFQFASLSGVWEFFRDVWVLEHFQEAWIAERVIGEIMKDPVAAMVEARSWADEASERVSEISEIECNIWDKAPQATECFSRNWRLAYVKLIEPYGQPEHPIYGRILRKHMLALLAKESASYRHPLIQSEHVDAYQGMG